MSRVQNTIRNYVTNLTITLVSNLLNVVSRTVFIYVLGADYLGVNGLFSNLLAMLSLAELGIGSAINFSLYKPIAENDDKKIISLMSFYKLCYRIIAMIVFIIGMIMMIFLDYLVKNPGNVENIRLIFFIYLINTSYSYLLSYKNTLVYAYQKNYLLFKSNLLFSILNVMSQIIVLIISRNYILYLLMNMFVMFLQRLYVNNLINREFPIVLIKNKSKIDKSEKETIVKNVKAMLWHKVGDYCINGTDNIVISSFLSLAVVGSFSNYLMIISMVNAYVNMIFNNMTASMGNLIATESYEKRLIVFRKINFIGQWLYGYVAVCLFVLLNPFICLWIGKTYTFSLTIVLVIVLNNYMSTMRIPPFIVKSAAGLYDDDKYVPIVQSVLNLTISIFLVKKLGLIGVFLGTFISGMLPSLYRPILIYKKVFKYNVKEYFLGYLINVILVIFSIIIINLIAFVTCVGSDITNFIILFILCVFIPNIVFWSYYHNKNEYKSIKIVLEGVIKSLWKKIKKR